MEPIQWNKNFKVFRGEASIKSVALALNQKKLAYAVIHPLPEQYYTLTEKEIEKLLNLDFGKGRSVFNLLRLMKPGIAKPRVFQSSRYADYQLILNHTPLRVRPYVIATNAAGRPLAIGKFKPPVLPITEHHVQKILGDFSNFHVESSTGGPLAIGKALKIKIAQYSASIMKAQVSVGSSNLSVARYSDISSRPIDEGTSIKRFPSIEAKKGASPGAELLLAIDLQLKEEDKTTETAGVEIEGLPEDWKEIPVKVQLLCKDLSFQLGKDAGTILVRRGLQSEKYKVNAVVSNKLGEKNSIEVIATFFYGTRYCGGARKLIPVATVAAKQKGQTQAAPPTSLSPTPEPEGIKIDPKVPGPHLTVNIHEPEKGSGELSWQLEVKESFPGLPAKLSGDINLGVSSAKFMETLVRSYGKVERPNHIRTFQGLGEAIYEKTPDCFKETYWALRDKYGSSFPIQFICDDPTIPWEFMRPFEPNGKTANFLMMDHPVARAFSNFEDTMQHMEGRLLQGKMITIAPDYTNVKGVVTLPHAQEEAALLIKNFQAEPKKNASDFLDLLETASATDPVGIIHYAGHGEFRWDIPNDSFLILEDRKLNVNEVRRQEVQLGKKFHTFVFFNSCELGSTGPMLGGVGGWPEAFIRGKFGGFLAPLWPVYDDDAKEVTAYFFDQVLKQHETIGTALMKLRVKYGEQSPTFFSYVYFGDVMARFN